MFFGKIKGTEEWGFYFDSSIFEKYKEIPNEEHIRIIEKANSENKIVKGDKNGNPVLSNLPEPTTAEKNNQKKMELKDYLYKTDWYVIRYIETGINIPNNIKAKRAEARKEISLLSNNICNS